MKRSLFDIVQRLCDVFKNFPKNLAMMLSLQALTDEEIKNIAVMLHTPNFRIVYMGNSLNKN